MQAAKKAKAAKDEEDKDEDEASLRAAAQLLDEILKARAPECNAPHGAC